MPIDDNGIGYSEWTIEKQRFFRSLVKINISMWNSALNNQPWKFEGNYTYFDITAGNGYHPEYGKGSPIIFIEEAVDSYKYNWLAHLYELNPVNVDSLSSYIEEHYPTENIYIYQGNHNETLQGWIKHKSSNRIPGLLYCDPTGEVPPFELIADFSKIWQCVDLLIAFSAANQKRIRCRFNRSELKDEIKSIAKKNILIREPYANHQWTFFYMSNGPIPAWKKEGFHNLCSSRGSEIFEKLNYTNEELNARQPTLFDISGIPTTPTV